MDVILGFWFVAVGLIGVLRPGFFYNSKKVTTEKIERNKRIWKRGGLGLIVTGVAELVLVLLRK